MSDSHDIHLTRRTLVVRAGGAAVALAAGRRPRPVRPGGASPEPTPSMPRSPRAGSTSHWSSSGNDPRLQPTCSWSRAFGYAGVALLRVGRAGHSTGSARQRPAKRLERPTAPRLRWRRSRLSLADGRQRRARFVDPAEPVPDHAGRQPPGRDRRARAPVLGRRGGDLPAKTAIHKTVRPPAAPTSTRQVVRVVPTDGGHEGYLRNSPPYGRAGPGLWVPTPPAFSPALQPFWGATALRVGAERLPARRAPAVFRGGRVGLLRRSARGVQPAPGDARAGGDRSFLVRRPGRDAHAARALDLDRDAGAAPRGRHRCDGGRDVCQGRDRGLRRVHRVLAHEVPRQPAAPGDLHPAADRPAWLPLLVTPPFPEYTSGHSVQSGAAFEVLTDCSATPRVRGPHSRCPRATRAPLRLLHRGGRGGGDLAALRRHPLPLRRSTRPRAGAMHRRAVSALRVPGVAVGRAAARSGRSRARSGRGGRRAGPPRRGTPRARRPARRAHPRGRVGGDVARLEPALRVPDRDRVGVVLVLRLGHERQGAPGGERLVGERVDRYDAPATGTTSTRSSLQDTACSVAASRIQ